MTDADHFEVVLVFTLQGFILSYVPGSRPHKGALAEKYFKKCINPPSNPVKINRSGVGLCIFMNVLNNLLLPIYVSTTSKGKITYELIYTSFLNV